MTDDKLCSTHKQRQTRDRASCWTRTDDERPLTGDVGDNEHDIDEDTHEGHNNNYDHGNENADVSGNSQYPDEDNE